MPCRLTRQGRLLKTSAKSRREIELTRVIELNDSGEFEKYSQLANLEQFDNLPASQWHAHHYSKARSHTCYSTVRLFITLHSQRVQNMARLGEVSGSAVYANTPRPQSAVKAIDSFISTLYGATSVFVLHSRPSRVAGRSWLWMFNNGCVAQKAQLPVGH